MLICKTNHLLRWQLTMMLEMSNKLKTEMMKSQMKFQTIEKPREVQIYDKNNNLNFRV